MTQNLFPSSSLKDTFAALRADLLHEHGPRISTMRNYRFAIVQYEPAQEFALRGEVQRLAVELRKGGWFVLSISLRQLLLDRVRAEDDDFIERVTEMERRTSARDQARGREYLKSKLIPLIEGKGGLADECATMIRQHVKDHRPPKPRPPARPPPGPAPPERRKPWQPEEDAALTAGWVAREGLDSLAARFGRSTRAISARLVHLGVVGSRGDARKRG